jgi:outer membrane protein assembly factor BamD
MKRRIGAAFAALLLALSACSSAKKSDTHFLDEVGTLSKSEILARGDAFASKKRWDDARKYYSFLADSFPNDPLGRKAALMVADTFYGQRDTESLTEAQLRYKDFANRFPSDPNRAYALLMLAKCSFAQHKGPQRDLKPLREAVDSLKQMLQLFPNSPNTGEAREMLAKCQEDLGQHELGVAQYYINVKAWLGAQQRLEYLLANYPQTQAAKAAEPLVEKIRERLHEKPARAEEAATKNRPAKS